MIIVINILLVILSQKLGIRIVTVPHLSITIIYGTTAHNC